MRRSFFQLGRKGMHQLVWWNSLKIKILSYFSLRDDVFFLYSFTWTQGWFDKASRKVVFIKFFKILHITCFGNSNQSLCILQVNHGAFSCTFLFLPHKSIAPLLPLLGAVESGGRSPSNLVSNQRRTTPGSKLSSPPVLLAALRLVVWMPVGGGTLCHLYIY